MLVAKEMLFIKINFRIGARGVAGRRSKGKGGEGGEEKRREA